MGGCSSIFYSNDSNKVTVNKRISLNAKQKENARLEKDKLLIFIKPYLSKRLGCSVLSWIQGSYKNHTLIRPVHKGIEFDIDVGLYVMCNAETHNISAATVRRVLNECLLEYVSVHDCKLDTSKPSCERVIYDLFHIDLPVYYYDEEQEICRLANLDSGWIDSDPKSYQDWFDKEIKKHDGDCVRRVIKYLKTWVALNWKPAEKAPPSIALNTLVLNLFENANGDDEIFSLTVNSINNFFNGSDKVLHPITGDDLLNFDSDQMAVLRGRLAALVHDSASAVNNTNLFLSVITWTKCFQHCFPPLQEIEIPNDVQVTGLPATTIPVQIVAELWSKSNGKLKLSSKVTADFLAYQNDEVDFYIGNPSQYPGDSQVVWLVRNQGEEAEHVHDLGHSFLLTLNERQHEHCEYDGSHYMECYVMKNNVVLGVGTIKVSIRKYRRPTRNPKRPAYTQVRKLR